MDSRVGLGTTRQIIGIACDVTSAADVAAMADVARSELGDIQIWVRQERDAAIVTYRFGFGGT